MEINPILRPVPAELKTSKISPIKPETDINPSVLHVVRRVLVPAVIGFMTPGVSPFMSVSAVEGTGGSASARELFATHERRRGILNRSSIPPHGNIFTRHERGVERRSSRAAFTPPRRL